MDSTDLVIVNFLTTMTQSVRQSNTITLSRQLWGSKHTKNNIQLFFGPICTSVLQKQHMQCTPLHSTYWGSVVSWWNTWACEDFEQVWRSSIHDNVNRLATFASLQPLLLLMTKLGCFAVVVACCHCFLEAHPVQKTRRHVLIHLWMELQVLWLLPYQSKSYHSIIFYSCCLLSTKIWVH